MPNEISLTIGATTATVPIKPGMTVTKINQAIKRYAIAKGIETEGRTSKQIGEDVLRSLIKYVSDTSMDKQRQDLLAEQQAALNTTLETDNDL